MECSFKEVTRGVLRQREEVVYVLCCLLTWRRHLTGSRGGYWSGQ